MSKESDDDNISTSNTTSSSTNTSKTSTKTSRKKAKRAKVKKNSNKQNKKLCPTEAKHTLKSNKKSIFTKNPKKTLPFLNNDEQSKKMSDYLDMKKEVLQLQSKNEPEQLIIA